MYGLPNTQAVIDAIADQIREEDTKKEQHVVKQSTVNSTGVGVAILTFPVIKPRRVGRTEFITIELVDEHYRFNTDHRRQGQASPSAAIIRTKKDSILILIDQRMLDWSSSDAPRWQQTISDTILYHELGHYFAGHLETTDPIFAERPFASLVNQTDLRHLDGRVNDVFPSIAAALLTGAISGEEAEADLYGMLTIDDPGKFLTLHSYLASVSDTLGIRMEHANRVNYLLERLEDTAFWTTIDRTKLPKVAFGYLRDMAKTPVSPVPSE